MLRIHWILSYVCALRYTSKILVLLRQDIKECTLFDFLMCKSTSYMYICHNTTKDQYTLDPSIRMHLRYSTSNTRSMLVKLVKYNSI